MSTDEQDDLLTPRRLVSLFAVSYFWLNMVYLISYVLILICSVSYFLAEHGLFGVYFTS